MFSRAHVFKLVSDIRASYWFVPSCLVIASVLFALGMLRLDAAGADRWIRLPAGFLDTQVDGARTILSVIASSIIGVTGVMFSVTMVAVSFASGNFGPRLVGNFMRDRGTQWSLGILISTFVYALIILRSIEGAAEGGTAAFVPQLSIVVAMAMALVSVFVMIYYVHHVPETINVSNIAAALGRRFCTALVDTAHDPEVRGRAGALTHTLEMGAPGYVQRLEITQLDEIAEAEELSLRVHAMPGSFVHAHQPVLSCDPAPSDEVAEALRDCFALGSAKTEDQNVLFLAEQHVEMIARALSPGVNDPHTAINCLNWVAAALAAGAAKGRAFGLEGTARVEIEPVGTGTLLEATFGAARPYVAGDEMALAHWNTLLDRLDAMELAHLSRAVAELRDGGDG